MSSFKVQICIVPRTIQLSKKKKNIILQLSMS